MRSTMNFYWNIMSLSIRGLLVLSILLLSASCRMSKNVSPKKKEGKAESAARILGVADPNEADVLLYDELANWIGVPYKFGGNDNSGVDCSGFVVAVYKKVYSISLERQSERIYNQCQKRSKQEVKPGDLVFFKINSEKVSHVGIIVQESLFIHASSSKGVTLSNLNEAYYTKHYFSCGAIRK
jgi:cell wall-associated NlpC family hydrolase